MALKATYKAQSEIPDALREFYTESDGVWVLDADVRDHPGARGVKSALDKERDEAKKLRERLAALEGVDPEEYKALKTAAEQAEHDRQKKAGEFDQLQKKRDDAHAKELQKVRDQFAAELKTANDNLARRDGFIQEIVLENAARAELEGKVLSVPLVLPHVMKKLRAVEDPETGRFRPMVLDEDGKSERLADSKGTPFTIKALIEEMGQSADFEPAWKGTGANGSGLPIGGGAPARRGATSISGDDEKGKSAAIDDIASGKVVVR